MCFDLDSRPPIPPIAGGALDSARLELTSSDGVPFLAFRARPTEPSGAAILILPDVRGLHPYYEELALRFAETGVDALAIDYFGRTAGTATPRDDTFDYVPHVQQTTKQGLAADIRTGLAELRRSEIDRFLFTVGFCFGGRLAFMSSAMGLGLAGAIGFYGRPTARNADDAPVPIDVVGAMRGGILGLFGGSDPGIPADSVEAFDAALSAAGIDHRLVTYPGAPHSFFDRKAAEQAKASESAWEEVLAFIRARTIAPA